MIYPGVDEALAAVIGAMEDDIAPHVQDDYAASLSRTATQMLRSVRVRLREEPDALAADNADLREVLAGSVDRLPTDVREHVQRVLDTPNTSGGCSVDELSAEATALRAALVQVIGAVDDSGDPVRQAAREYLRRQLGREAVWMRDAFTGPRR